MIYRPVSRDPRITVTHESPRRFIVRVGSELVAERMFYSSAVALAVGEHARRNGAAAIEAR